MDAVFHYAERLSAPGLRPWLWNYWEFRVLGDDRESVPHHVPPDGCTSIALMVSAGTLRHAAASGPWLEPLVVPGIAGAVYWGVRFRPESGALALGVVPDRLVNRNQPLDTLAPPLAQALREAIERCQDFDQAVAAMDRIFGSWLAPLGEPDPLARDAVNRLIASGGEETIAHLAQTLTIPPRTLLRRFRAGTGLSPKQFARICRFRLAAFKLIESRRPQWAQVASGSGFADQAHMIHEFKDLTGLTPEGLDAVIRKTSHGDLIA